MKGWWYGDSSSDAHNYLSVYVQSTMSGGIRSWNDIGCSGSPGPEGPTCNYSSVWSVDVPDSCALDQGSGANDGYCNWCNCEVNDVEFIDYLADFIERQKRPLGEFTEEVVEAAHQRLDKI